MPRAYFLGYCAALAALLQGILAVLDAASWTRILALVVVAAVALLAEGDKWRTKRLEKAAADAKDRVAADEAAKLWLRNVEQAVRLWPPPRIDDVDLSNLGVKLPSRPKSAGPKTRGFGPYVRRDVEMKAARQLQSLGSLLLIGEPASGVTRTAAELAKEEGLSRRVLAPRPPDGLRRSLDELDVLAHIERPGRLVLWLDQIDDHSSDGLTVSMLRRFHKESPGSRIIATINSTHFAEWQARVREVAEFFGEPALLTRLPSTSEREAAEHLYPDVDFTQGVAAALTGTGALITRLLGGNTECPFEPSGGDCALTRALVHIALSWCTTGTPRPLTGVKALDIARRRIPSRSPSDLEAHAQSCLAWATKPVLQGVSLITATSEQQAGVTIRANQQVADTFANDESGPDVDVWSAALDDASVAADSDAIGRIGYSAHLRGYLNLADQVWDQIAKLDEPAVAWLERAAEYGRSPGSFVLATRKLLELKEAAHGPNHIAVAQELEKLADAQSFLGEQRKAIELYQRALTIKEREYGPDHQEVADTLNDLGTTWDRSGDPRKAIDLYQRSLTIKEREYGPDHRKVAHTLTNLGIAWGRLGEPRKAIDLYQRALTIQEQESGADNLEVAHILDNLGTAWVSLGEYRKAIELYERALRIVERTYGPSHREVARTLSNLGNPWTYLGEQRKAIELYQRALTIKEREYGPDHLEIATTLTNLGTGWHRLGQPRKAVELSQRALTIKEREYGPDHREVASTLNNLASAWADLGEYRTSIDLFDRALTIEQREYGPDHPEVAATLNNLGNAWDSLGKTEKARGFYIRALRIQRTHYPSGHPLTSILIRNLRQVAPDLVVLDSGQIMRADK